VYVLLLAILLTAPGLTPVPPSSRARGPVLRPATGAQIVARAKTPGARATLVSLWATWCAPCREEFPMLLRVARAHRADGLRLMLVSADFADQRDAVRCFLTTHGVTDTSWIKSGADMDFIDALDPKWSGALPATLLYDSRGRLEEFWEGAADSTRFEAAIGRALAADTTRMEEPR
jgi:thiol-disulfide isomerase/thioredoxin